MMEFNLTLFVQMGNFFLAYFILRKYIFLPALHILDVVERKQIKLQEEVDSQERAYQEQSRIYQMHVKEKRKKLEASAPHVIYMQVGTCQVPEITAQQVQPTILQQDIEKAKQVIVQSLCK